MTTFPFPSVGEIEGHPVLGAQVSWGYNPDTLEPVVQLSLRLEQDPENRITFIIPPDFSIGLVEQLQWAIDRCRANHFDPDSVKFEPAIRTEVKPLPWAS